MVITIGNLKPEAIPNISHIKANPAELVAVIVLAPAALEPTQADIAECYDSTQINSLLTIPSATNSANFCITGVWGVIGNAAHTSGLICLIASADASAPVNAFIFAILFDVSLSLAYYYFI